MQTQAHTHAIDTLLAMSDSDLELATQSRDADQIRCGLRMLQRAGRRYLSATPSLRAHWHDADAQETYFAPLLSAA